MLHREREEEGEAQANKEGERGREKDVDRLGLREESGCSLFGVLVKLIVIEEKKNRKCLYLPS